MTHKTNMQKLSLYNHSTMVTTILKLFAAAEPVRWKKYTMVAYWQCFPTPCSVTLCWQFDIGYGVKLANTTKPGLIYCVIECLDLGLR